MRKCGAEEESSQQEYALLNSQLLKYADTGLVATRTPLVRRCKKSKKVVDPLAGLSSSSREYLDQLTKFHSVDEFDFIEGRLVDVLQLKNLAERKLPWKEIAVEMGFRSHHAEVLLEIFWKQWIKRHSDTKSQHSPLTVKGHFCSIRGCIHATEYSFCSPDALRWHMKSHQNSHQRKTAVKLAVTNRVRQYKRNNSDVTRVDICGEYNSRFGLERY